MYYCFSFSEPIRQKTAEEIEITTQSSKSIRDLFNAILDEVACYSLQCASRSGGQ